MPRKNSAFKDERTLRERRTAKAYDALQRAEENLSRALRKWDKARQQLRRLTKAADKKRAGEPDWRELQKSADQVKDPDDWDRLHAP